MVEMENNGSTIRVSIDRVEYLESKGWVRTDAAIDKTSAEAEQTDESEED